MRHFHLHLNIGTSLITDSSDFNLGETPFVRIDDTFEQCDGAYGLHSFLYDIRNPDTDEADDALCAEMQQVIDAALDRVQSGATSGTFAVNGVDYFFAVGTADRFGNNFQLSE